MHPLDKLTELGRQDDRSLVTGTPIGWQRTALTGALIAPAAIAVAAQLPHSAWGAAGAAGLAVAAVRLTYASARRAHAYRRGWQEGRAALLDEYDAMVNGDAPMDPFWTKRHRAEDAFL